MIKRLLLLIGLIWLCISCEKRTPGVSSNHYKTKNVIILVLDGERYTETWGDPTHVNIPHRANDIAPFGIIGTSFYSNGTTSTNPGHAALSTGVYENINNAGTTSPTTPSIFQRWRKHARKDSTTAWVIASKGKLDVLGNCTDPSWTNLYMPSVNCGADGLGNGNRDDSATMAIALDVLSNHHPQLMLINLKDPDIGGHSGVWQNYIDGIQHADRLLFELWNYINNDPYYAETTTLFVTNDHGRHSDNSGGFVGHGDNCDGCRHLNFFAFGPDFHADSIIDIEGEQIDIPATISKLLAVPNGMGDGRFMDELIK